jgi:hypothetical protein
MTLIGVLVRVGLAQQHQDAQRDEIDARAGGARLTA